MIPPRFAFLSLSLVAIILLVTVAIAVEPAAKPEGSSVKTPPPKMVPVNLAKGKSATASSEEKGKNNVANNAFDGSGSSRWCANGGKSGEWLQVDLGQPQRTVGCQIDWENPNGTYQYKLEGSLDGQTWKMLSDAAKNDKAGPTIDRFDAEVRYVRVTFLGSKSRNWGSIWEMEVWGDKMVVAETAPVANHRSDALLKDVKVPEGFEATIFAAPPAANYPVFVGAAPDGTLYVSSDANGSLGRGPHRGRILRLRDVDNNGRADEVKLFKSDIDSPRGLVWDNDRLFLMHPPHLSVLIDKDGDGLADEQKLLVKNIAFDFKGRPADHTSNGVTLGIDGWLYLAIGDFGFMEAEGTDGTKLQFRSGGVVRVRTDGTGLEVYSRGTRNILEVAIDPLLNGYTRDNTNDGGGWDIRLHHFTGLDHHGYPSLFKNFGDEIVQPIDIYGGGSGCGALYLDEPGFPEGYGDALYTVDWGRSWVYRHRLTANGATVKADQREFVSVPRATDLDVDALSRLYVASWHGGNFNYVGENVGFIARVTPKGFQPQKLPEFADLSAVELVQQLESASHRRRLEAQRELIRRGLDDVTTNSVKALAGDTSKPLPTRIAAIFALKQALKNSATPILVQLTQDAAIREYALRALTDHKGELAGVSAEPIVAATKDANPRVRRQAVESLARLGKVEHAFAVAPLVADSDPIVAHTAVNALAELKASAACFAVIDRTDATTPERGGALRAIQRLHEPAVVDGLIARLEKETDSTRRAGLLTALCRLHSREGVWKGDSWGTRPDTSGPYYQTNAWEETPKITAALQAAFSNASPQDAVHLVGELSRHKIRINQTLDKIVALASQDATFIPAVVAQLVQEKEIPAAAIPLVIQAATADHSAPAVRSQAALVLSNVGSAEATLALLQALPLLDTVGKGGQEFVRARAAFLGSRLLQNQYPLFITEAEKLNGASSRWAEAGLLVIAHQNDSSPEARAATTKALEAGWSKVPHRLQILEAVRVAQFKPYKSQVLGAMTDKDKSVADAAKRTADELKFLIKSTVKPSGPKLAAMKVDDVVAATLEQKGDPNLGEELFAKLNCTKCHTVRQEEAPRGPFLGNIANTYKRKELAESVLLPSKTLAQGFVTQIFILDDGRTLTGFVVQEGADKVIIRNAEAQEFVIPVTSIEERAKQNISMMPEGLVKDITVPEFASLIDYIESLAKGKK